MKSWHGNADLEDFWTQGCMEYRGQETRKQGDVYLGTMEMETHF